MLVPEIQNVFSISFQHLCIYTFLAILLYFYIPFFHSMQSAAMQRNL